MCDNDSVFVDAVVVIVVTIDRNARVYTENMLVWVQINMGTSEMEHNEYILYEMQNIFPSEGQQLTEHSAWRVVVEKSYNTRETKTQNRNNTNNKQHYVRNAVSNAYNDIEAPV